MLQHLTDFNKKLASLINEEKAADERVVCLALIHTFAKFVISDDNPHNKNVERKQREERALHLMNVVFETYDERLSFAPKAVKRHPCCSGEEDKHTDLCNTLRLP